MSSPFAAQLGTNYCPQDEELAQINDLLIEPCLRLKHLDDEIAVMQKAINKLNEERDALTTYVEAHRALIFPVRRLPLDIMEEIFMACLPTHRNCVMSAQEAPIILGRICSSWRTISLSTPRLWSRLHIVEPTLQYGSTHGLYEAKVAQRLEVANTWLRRSGNCPLAISLESNLNQGMASSSSPVFLNLIVPLASRWQHIRLTIPPWSLEAALSRLTENDVPLLKSLKIVQRPDHTNDNTDGSHWSLSQSGVLHGSSLSRFSIVGNRTSASELRLRWNQLTSLSLAGPSWGIVNEQTCQVVLDILSRCPELRICKLVVQGVHKTQQVDSFVECPYIHTLHLYGPLYSAGRLLSSLSLPVLQDFKFGANVDHGILPTMDSLVSFLAASIRLESISIGTLTFSKPFLVEVLCCLPPTIRRLEILEPSNKWGPSLTDGPLDDDVLAAFDVSPDRSTHCPALQELVISNCRQISDKALLRFIISRVPTLRLVNIKFERAREIDILPSLQSFVETGLQTSITYISPVPPQFSPWMGLPDAPSGLGMPPLMVLP